MNTDSVAFPKAEGAIAACDYWNILRATLLASGTLASIVLLGNYGLIGASLVWTPYVLCRPREGLWVVPALVMVASIVCPPEGFEWGAGYSPQLVYWAVAICLLFVAMLVPYFRRERPKLERVARAPRSFYFFASACVLATLIGLAHEYALLNVAKQFFGCALFCGYFLFALRFAPKQKDIEHVLARVFQSAALCAVVYSSIYLYRVPELGFRKELTILSTYTGGLAVILIPQILKKDTFSLRRFTLAGILFAVPLLAQFKRAIVACAVCGLLAYGMRAKSIRRRYGYLAAAFLFFTITITTGLLNPIGAWFSRYPALEKLFPEDIQSSYSVFLRLEESRQVLNSIGAFPIFGTGLGSTITWFDPYSNVVWEQETLDVGWVYLLVKLGLLGTIAFVLFMSRLGKDSLQKPIRGMHLGLFLLLIFHLLQLVADPAFVYFMTAAWVGMTCAFLHILNRAPC